MQFTDAEIQRLQAKLAAMQTARMAYAGAAQEGLNGKPAAAPIADISGDTIQFNYLSRATFGSPLVFKAAS